MAVTKAISAPVERVWEVFADLAGRPRWMSEVDSIEVLTPGPLRASHHVAGDAARTPTAN